MFKAIANVAKAVVAVTRPAPRVIVEEHAAPVVVHPEHPEHTVVAHHDAHVVVLRKPVVVRPRH